MTYYRAISYPAASNADVPDDLWREFQRIRDNLMRLDQNNTRTDGITRARIASPYTAVHNGVSDINTSGVANTLAFSEATAARALTKADHDGIWQTDPNVSLEVYSRWDAPWVIGFSAGFVVTSALANYAHGDVTVGVNGIVGAYPASPMDVANTAAAPMSWVAVLLPSGTTTINLLYRARWGGYTGGINYLNRRMFAFGLYR